MIILLHSSKTMKSSPVGEGKKLREPVLLDQAEYLYSFIKKLSPKQLQKVMQISAPLAHKTHIMMANWSSDSTRQGLALDSFIGDIYSGLQATELSSADREYADQTLYILSGLYGLIRPYDGICPYRLEMAYKLPYPKVANLYTYWGETITNCLPSSEVIVNTSSLEYSQAVLPYLNSAQVVTPKFLTVNPSTGEPTFVVVHAKIARGAFARWLITSRVTNPILFKEFADLGYQFSEDLSTRESPTFICQVFGGIGLSMRLK